jgi:hypothetical protein
MIVDIPTLAEVESLRQAAVSSSDAYHSAYDKHYDDQGVSAEKEGVVASGLTVIQQHLAYLEEKVAYCNINAEHFKGSIYGTEMSTSAGVYAQVVAKLRNIMGME